MKFMFIEKLPVGICNFKNVAAQPSADRIGHQDKVAVNAIFFAHEPDS